MILICTIIAGMIFAVDIVIKQHIEDHLEDGETREIMDGKVEIRKVHNHGFALNLLEKKPNIVKIVSVLAGIILVIYEVCLFFKKGRLREKLGGAIALGGAFSNMYDRIVRGYVVDYFGFKTKWTKLKKITFNIGDFCLMIGMVIMAFSKKD